MENPKPILFEEGQIKVKWEDTQISIPFNFENMNEVVLYKVVRGMQNQINNLENEMKRIKENKIDIIEDSLKDLWENEYDNRWSID